MAHDAAGRNGTRNEEEEDPAATDDDDEDEVSTGSASFSSSQHHHRHNLRMSVGTQRELRRYQRGYGVARFLSAVLLMSAAALVGVAVLCRPSTGAAAKEGGWMTLLNIERASTLESQHC